MIKTIHDLLTNAIVRLEPIITSAGMSERSTDYLMMLSGGLLLVAIAIITLAICLVYGATLILAYKRMIGMKSRRLRRNWSIVFFTVLGFIILEVIRFI